MKIAISGGLGVVGRGVARSLRLSSKYKHAQITALDTMESRFGTDSGLFDSFIKSVNSGDEDYTNWFESSVSKENFDAILFCPELETFKQSYNVHKVSLIPDSNFCEVAISKSKTFDVLKGTGLVPKTFQGDVGILLDSDWPFDDNSKLWLRNSSPATTGGDGSFPANDQKEAKMWLAKFLPKTEFQVSEFLPGRNLCVIMLFKDGELVASVNGERISYLLSHLSPSGVTGYTSHGKVFIDNNITKVALEAVSYMPSASALDGIITVDLKEDHLGNPKVTEINIRYIGFVSAFALAGFNIVEKHLDAIMGIPVEGFLSQKVFEFRRGIDGLLETYEQ